ncbi:hypothetical protein SAMN04488038_101325 [Solimonas aquatica]|uniref:Uncharacterized protein n=1 Tax=Solimonas aquatica TaxID=489703 RepID=A0A1H9A9G8_9GAMM|nr:hypothetical protein SAMN04488038_101325 [Solimonas aquatica]
MWPHADSRRWLAAAVALWLALATPPLRASLESSMAWHMLMQLPLLAGVGYLAGVAWLQARSGSVAARTLKGTQSFNAGGATGIIAASFAMLLWMLPRGLDLARLDVAIDALKFATVPLAGLAIALSWPRLPVIARAVVHLEVIATFFRFGWGYLTAEQRLCLAYLTDDQARTGELLLWFGAIYAAAVTWRPLFGPAPRQQRELDKTA